MSRKSSSLSVGRLSLVAGAALFALAGAALSAVAQEARSPVVGNPAIGKKVYYDHGCYGCHGFNGETGVRDLVGTGSPIITNEAVFIGYLRGRGEVAPVLPSTAMPHYGPSALSEQDARHLYAYVASLKLDAPEIDRVPAFKTILESASRPFKR